MRACSTDALECEKIGSWQRVFDEDTVCMAKSGGKVCLTKWSSRGFISNEKHSSDQTRMRPFPDGRQ